MTGRGGADSAAPRVTERPPVVRGPDVAIGSEMPYRLLSRLKGVPLELRRKETRNPELFSQPAAPLADPVIAT